MCSSDLSAWSLTGGFAEIVFCGVPSLNVVNQALTRQDGSTALIAENGTALVQAADRALSREGAGTPIELSRYDAGEARLDNFSYFTVLADGSGLLAANNIDDANIRMFNTSTGTQEWGMSGYSFTLHRCDDPLIICFETYTTVYAQIPFGF